MCLLPLHCAGAGLASNEYSLLYFRLSDGQKISSTWLQICGDNIDIMRMQ